MKGWVEFRGWLTWWGAALSLPLDALPLRCFECGFAVVFLLRLACNEPVVEWLTGEGFHLTAEECRKLRYLPPFPTLPLWGAYLYLAASCGAVALLIASERWRGSGCLACKWRCIICCLFRGDGLRRMGEQMGVSVLRVGGLARYPERIASVVVAMMGVGLAIQAMRSVGESAAEWRMRSAEEVNSSTVGDRLRVAFSGGAAAANGSPVFHTIAKWPRRRGRRENSRGGG